VARHRFTSRQRAVSSATSSTAAPTTSIARVMRATVGSKRSLRSLTRCRDRPQVRGRPARRPRPLARHDAPRRRYADAVTAVPPPSGVRCHLVRAAGAWSRWWSGGAVAADQLNVETESAGECAEDGGRRVRLALLDAADLGLVDAGAPGELLLREMLCAALGGDLAGEEKCRRKASSSATASGPERGPRPRSLR
jgi:hypothetical protein